MNDKATNIQVFQDGVKIGWNIMALAASVGLAFYVTSIVSPLKEELIENKNMHKNGTIILDSMKNSIIDLQYQIKSLETNSALQSRQFVNNLEKLENELNEYTRGGT